jgi:O-antigen ligase
MSPTLVVALALVAIPVLSFAAIRWRRAIVMALPFLAILNGLAIPLGASSIRADQLAASILLAPLAAALLIGARRLRTDSTVWLIGAVLGLNVIASALNSPARTYSLLQCVNLATVWVIYLLLINFLETREDAELFLRRCIQAAMIASVIGIVAFLLAIAGFNVGGAEVSTASVEYLTKAYGASGTMVEPNIFGSFTAAHLVLSVVLLTLAGRMPSSVIPTRVLTALAALSAAGLVLSFTRAAWLGAVAGIVLYLLLGGRALGLRVRLPRMFVPVAVGATVVLLIVLGAGNAGNLLRFKVLNLVNFQSPTAALRLATYAVALQQVLAHPVLGWGTFTFAPLVAGGADFQRFEGWRNLWIGDYLLLALHDTGVVGLLTWLALLWSSLAGGIRAARASRESDPLIAGRTIALTAAVATLLIPYLATTGFSLGFTWVLIGLLGVYRHLSLSAPEPAPLPQSIAAEYPT